MTEHRAPQPSVRPTTGPGPGGLPPASQPYWGDDAALVVAVVLGVVWAVVSGAGGVAGWGVALLATLEVVRRRGVRALFAARGPAVPRMPSHLPRVSDLPVVLVLAWTGWLALPWGLSAPAAQNGQPASLGPVPAKSPAAPQARRDVYHEVAERAAVRERARIASEVHDVAGHGLAAIAMQAKLALLMLDERPEQARASLEAIRSTSTRALADLRAALDTMAPAEPRAGAGRDGGPYDLRGLVENVRAAGLPVDLEVDERAGAAPAHVAAAVHRIVQESLTNVMRHAGPTRAVVRVAHEPTPDGTPGDLVVDVSDRGVGSAAVRASEGRGMAGMRARARAAGGCFNAGPRDDGGFRVVARFPRADGGASCAPRGRDEA
ncbi:histidine kinase [Spongiactinospora sp. TRM90649]|uniref:sensor histidine kinase n=1 Tax=Spongiactinospora sp. TRM90649 TaxID=3031114 RepID=UPI0023F8C650|nr:histidine kinase [Spongiactinospora sp. TRM90649]MDF5751918.1 histidine kinase [Spongiactinospora sp. TRM90649]